jgi:RND superfamily putative drug exporter
MALRATERLSEATGLTVPDILKPLMVALVLGIVTDYTIFYASTMQSLLTNGVARVPAARQTTAQITPIVVAGGAILAASLASLQVAQLSFFRAVGPGLAVSVLVASSPPSRSCRPRWPCSDGALLAEPPARGPFPTETEGRHLPSRLAHLQARRSLGFVVAAACVAVLAAAAWQLPNIRVGFTSIRGLPADAQERQAADAVSRAFAPGMLAPTEVLAEGVGSDDALALIRLQAAIRRQPGVAAVAGPAQQLGRTDVTAFRQGDAACYIVAFDSDPHGATAIGDANRLRERLPARPLGRA